VILGRIFSPMMVICVCYLTESPKLLTLQLHYLVMEKIRPVLTAVNCEYCPNAIKSITIPDENADELNDSRSPPSYIEIECPKCENTFYYSQGNWDVSLGGRTSSSTIDTRKTSPGKNTYVPKEDVIDLQ